jgi:uncharacterized Zn finger protein
MSARRRGYGSSRWEPWDDFARGPRIRVDDGLKAKSRRGDIGASWWSRRFIAVLERFGEGPRLARGRTYARAGQVMSLELTPGLVSARVQGSHPTPYRVEIHVPVLDAADWTRAEEMIASRAIFLARLLSGEMPDEIEEAFEACRLSLFPSKRTDFVAACSCPDSAALCKHIAAVYYLLAERFDDDPFLVLAWRGRPREQLLAELRALRGEAEVTAAGPVAADGPWWAAPGAAEPLPADPARFWGAPSDVGVAERGIAGTVRPGAILRELPPSGIVVGGRPVEESLERICAAVAAVIATGTDV